MGIEDVEAEAGFAAYDRTMQDTVPRALVHAANRYPHRGWGRVGVTLTNGFRAIVDDKLVGAGLRGELVFHLCVSTGLEILGEIEGSSYPGFVRETPA